MRRKIANWLVRLAVKIYPESDAVKEFYLHAMTHSMIDGGAMKIDYVNPEDMYQPPKEA